LVRGERPFCRFWRYRDRSCFDAQHIVKHLHDDGGTLGRAVMVAIAIGAPFKHKGGEAHGGLIVFVTIVDVIFKGLEGTPKVWSRYQCSLAFRYESSDTPESNIIGHCNLLTITLVAIIYLLSLFIEVHLMQVIVLAYILHLIHFIDFESD
jgi:hypothetical protein